MPRSGLTSPVLSAFSAPVAAWFEERFGEPTAPQRLGWPVIGAGEDVLIAAPTGSGKTLTAFLGVLDGLVRKALDGRLENRVYAVYVTPLRALSHDIQRNLDMPLAGIEAEAQRMGLADGLGIRTAVRTGDTPASARAAMLRKPPHILVTTPESLFLLLTAQRSAEFLRGTETVIVDEIHALARDRRGTHLALTLERLEDLLASEGVSRPQRIGLSATQRPLDRIGRFLVGGRDRAAPHILDLGHQRDLDLLVEVPEGEELQAVMPMDQWERVLDRLADLIRGHRTTLVFVNQRRMAERLAHRLGERLGTERVAAHHGSLSKDRRLQVETRLKDGELDALVATASLELGIDIGHVDLVCQVASPRSIATFLQRVGRSGHALGLVPKGRLFPTTRDELCECAALARAVGGGRLDRIHIPEAPLDILAQQIVAATAVRTFDEDELFALVRGASPYAALSREDFDAILTMLAEGLETPRGRRGVHIHRDRVNGRVRGRRGARLAALTSGSPIADMGDYRVVLEPDEQTIGTVGEDWAVESMVGDIFVLGTHSWRIRKVENGTVRVIDAQGAPPTIPFWAGEAPARTDELSQEVAALRQWIVDLLAGSDDEGRVASQVAEACALDLPAATQLVHYVRLQRDAVGVVPTQKHLLAERFFDDSGGMQLVIHAPMGARINRGLGLALRKRFCRAFNMELQAAASDDAVVLSLGNPQTFDLNNLPRFLNSGTLRDVLSQAMLGSPLFGVRWRWNATRSLVILRSRGGKRLPFNIQRMEADDLLAAAFPDQAACQEHVTYPLDIPDHPLVRQTMTDCLVEAADVEGLTRLIQGIEEGSVTMHVRDTVEPSPFAHEILTARPYAFLDDAPLEERRTRAVALRHVLPENARDLARLEPAAIEKVRDEVVPDYRDPDELHELLMDLVVAPVHPLNPLHPLHPLHPLNPLNDTPGVAVPSLGGPLLDALVRDGRAGVFSAEGRRWGFVVERLRDVQALHPDAVLPGVTLPAGADPGPRTPQDALDAAVRGWITILGPTSLDHLSHLLAVPVADLAGACARLESRGILLRGAFDEALAGEQVCDRRLLARIHRYTLETLRKSIQPVTAQTFMGFLLRWQHLHPDEHMAGEEGLLEVVTRLAGFQAPVQAWEKGILARRMHDYRSSMLDGLCLSGQVAWGRIAPATEGGQPSRATPVALWPRPEAEEILSALVAGRGAVDGTQLRGPASRLLEALRDRGALFHGELQAVTRLLPSELEEGLRDLVAQGWITADGFAPVRRLLHPRGSRGRRARPSILAPRTADAGGRWSVLRPLGGELDVDAAAEQAALRLLARYGIVFRDLAQREILTRPWRDIRFALARLEARGIIRGGRFVAGVAGEHFATPDAVAALRRERSRPPDGIEIPISASDPVNLAGIVTPGHRIPARHTVVIVLRDGLPIAIEDRGRRADIAASP